jgi:hypothetical protein
VTLVEEAIARGGASGDGTPTTRLSDVLIRSTVADDDQVPLESEVRLAREGRAHAADDSVARFLCQLFEPRMPGRLMRTASS